MLGQKDQTKLCSKKTYMISILSSKPKHRPHWSCNLRIHSPFIRLCKADLIRSTEHLMCDRLRNWYTRSRRRRKSVKRISSLRTFRKEWMSKSSSWVNLVSITKRDSLWTEFPHRKIWLIKSTKQHRDLKRDHLSMSVVRLSIGLKALTLNL